MTLPVTADWERRPLRIINHETGKSSQTLWKVLQPVNHCGLPATRVLLSPLTGRTHQLRLRMAATGHAILGDALYAWEALAASPRLLLHAAALEMTHPVTGTLLKIESTPDASVASPRQTPRCRLHKNSANHKNQRNSGTPRCKNTKKAAKATALQNSSASHQFHLQMKAELYPWCTSCYARHSKNRSPATCIPCCLQQPLD